MNYFFLINEIDRYNKISRFCLYSKRKIVKDCPGVREYRQFPCALLTDYPHFSPLLPLVGWTNQCSQHTSYKRDRHTTTIL